MGLPALGGTIGALRPVVALKENINLIFDVSKEVWSIDVNDSEDNLEESLIEANVEFQFSSSEYTGESVTVTITLNDELQALVDSGIYILQYNIGDPTDESSWIDYTESGIVVTENSTIYARLTDGENVGHYATGYITNIDKTAPEMTISIELDEEEKTLIISGTANDEFSLFGNSGVKEVYIAIVGENIEYYSDEDIAWKLATLNEDGTFEYTFDVETVTTYKIGFKALDNVGNENLIYRVNSYIGYYADVDSDGTVDGIIYVDLADDISGEESGSWGTYSYDSIDITDLKEYEISTTTYTDTYFGENYIVTPKAETTGEQRFYIIELSDHLANDDSTAKYSKSYGRFLWYQGAYYDNYTGSYINDYATVTSTEFGAGLENSITMKALWEASYYGSQNYNSNYDDVWSIDDIGQNLGETDSVWFLPSRGELVAFANVFELTTSNYSSYGLNKWYWCSSLHSSDTANYLNFNSGWMGSDYIWGYYYYVRLCTTF